MPDEEVLPNDSAPAEYARRGLEHPDERIEYARFCLLTHYERNEDFMRALASLAERHSRTLWTLARAAGGAIHVAADYRLQWGLMSFLTRQAAGGRHDPLGEQILTYRRELSDLADCWGLAASWCAPSLHLALVTPLMYPGSRGAKRTAVRSLTPFFGWDEGALGEPHHDTNRSLLRLLVLSDAHGRQVDFRVFTLGGRHVYYDPRVDLWREVLAEVRALLRRRRLPSSNVKHLSERRHVIERKLVDSGYRLRPKPRRLDGEHAIARRTRWTYWVTCPPRMTTTKILGRMATDPHTPSRGKDSQVVDRGIKEILNLLALPRR